MKRLLLILVLVLGLINPSFAEIDWQPINLFDFSGGLNDGDAPTQIKNNQAATLQNVEFTTGGNFKTRSGSSIIVTGVVFTGTALQFYKPTSGSRFIVGVFNDNKIRKVDYASSGGPDKSWDDITGSLSFSVDEDDLASFAVGEDILIIEDGVNTTAPYKWDGTGNAEDLGGSPPNCKMVAYHKNHAFCAGNDSNPSTLYFSDINDIENWTTGLSGNLSIETNDGTEITAINPGFDSLYIWKGNPGVPTGTIWRLTGDDKDNFELQRMVSGIGTLSSQSVSLIGNDFFFMDGKGDIYLYDGAVKLQLISANIQGTIDSLNLNRLQDVSSTVLEKDFYVSVSSVGSSRHDTILVFDTFNQAWTKYKGMPANTLAVVDDGSGGDMLVFSNYTGVVLKHPSGTNDDGTAIDTFLSTKQFRFPELSINKTLKKIYAFVNQEGNYNLNLEIRKNFGTTGTTTSINLLGVSSLYGTAVYGTDLWGGQNLIIETIEPDVEGIFFQFNFSNENLDEPFEFKGMSLYIEESDEI